MKYKAYTQYKQSNIDWVSEIPNSWQILPAFSVVKNTCIKNVDGTEDNVLSLSYGNIVKRNLDDNFGLLPESFNTYQIVLEGNIILRLTDLQNDKKSLRVGYVTQKGIITSAYLKIACSKSINPKYAYFLLHSYDLTKVFYGMGGGLRQSMKFDDLKRLPMIIPSYSEQLSIVRFLDAEVEKIDRLIDKQEQLIELLKEKRQAVISHAVTKGLNPDVKLKYSGIEWLGNFPEHWEVTRLKYECSNIVDCLHSTPEYSDIGQFPAIRTADIISGFLDVENAKKVSLEVFLERNSRLTPLPGDIIYSREGERFGIAAFVPEEAKVCLGQRVMLFRVKKCSLYYMWAINATSTYEQALQDVIGATSPHINVETIKNFHLPRPPIKEQEEISEYIQVKINKFDKLVVIASKKISLLQERRSALISSAVTGKIDVRNWQPDAKDVA